ncbi:hypothetical protein JF72_15050 (plasmid) [Lactobacillus apis]|uniref:Uncharacterized protein n=2 Tax=Lactobacillus apis TaxID=303541 RepID=A0A0F4LLF4_9LACO|nr:hypothetical protein JF72_15050 [Lactobacillus apis]
MIMTKTVENIFNFTEEDDIEIRETRTLDKWIINLAQFLKTEKAQLFKLYGLKGNDKLKNNRKFSDMVDDQIYEVYKNAFPEELLQEHNLTIARDDFEAVMYLDPELVTRGLISDEEYVKCFSF